MTLSIAQIQLKYSQIDLLIPRTLKSCLFRIFLHFWAFYFFWLHSIRTAGFYCSSFIRVLQALPRRSATVRSIDFYISSSFKKIRAHFIFSGEVFKLFNNYITAKIYSIYPILLQKYIWITLLQVFAKKFLCVAILGDFRWGFQEDFA